MKSLMALALGLSVLVPLVGFAKTAPATKFCTLQSLKKDKALSQKLVISTDPAGLAIEAKTNDANVDKLLQHYSDEHQCTLSSMSMMDLVKGLFKGSAGSLPQGAGGSSDLQKMGQKYLLVAGDKSICIKKLGLELPIKSFTPTEIKFCSMQALKSDKTLSKALKFAKDPIGLAAESKKADTDVEHLFKDYAVKNKCTLYAISMKALMKGLLKGSSDSLNTETSPSSGMTQSAGMQSNKYLLVEGDKAICVKKLGLELPLEAFLPD